MTNTPVEKAFTIDTSSIKFGPGITNEAGFELSRLDAQKCDGGHRSKMADSHAVKRQPNH
ncbi:MAG: hypothetical protein CM1200mP39_22530 [Dehalococcoidia bacterium]|nr:MAG: hypothetical protein CM1200mP39_22530 [Dehalococcoidia bacterium]